MAENSRLEQSEAAQAPTLATLFERIAEAANEPSHDLALRLTGIRLMALEAKRIAEEREQRADRDPLEADAIVLMYPLPSPSPDFELVGPFDSVDEAMQWVKDHPRLSVTPRLKEMRKRG